MGRAGPAPLVSGYVDLAEQLQPNGFDLTLGQVAQFAGTDGSGGDTGGGGGRLGVSGADRELPSTRPLPRRGRRLVAFGAGGVSGNFQ